MEDDGGKTTITDNGVYIEGLNGKFYTVDNWKGGNDANSVAVASGDVKFRIALTQAPSTMEISRHKQGPLDNYMTEIWYETEAMVDYDGAGNTAKIMQMQPSTQYAAGYCDAFVFPDDKTKGYLPAFGQLNLVYLNKAAVDVALNVCGGTAMSDGKYWSSTFRGVNYDDERQCWQLDWGNGKKSGIHIGNDCYVRAFANLG